MSNQYGGADNPFRFREAATDLLLLFGGTGLAAAIEASGGVSDERQLVLAAKLEWALHVVGIGVGEIEASSARVQAMAASRNLDAEIADLLGAADEGGAL